MWPPLKGNLNEMLVSRRGLRTFWQEAFYCHECLGYLCEWAEPMRPLVWHWLAPFGDFCTDLFGSTPGFPLSTLVKRSPGGTRCREFIDF